jgi:phosphate transport system protein
MATAELGSRSESQLVLGRTLRACQLAHKAATCAADALLPISSVAALKEISESERELDQLDRQLDDAVATAVVQASADQARELLACLKFMIDLERIGDLICSFATRAAAISAQLQMEDVHDLTTMCVRLAQMLVEAQQAFANRDVTRALAVIRADLEIDRLRQLILLRHLEDLNHACGPDAIHVVCMAHALERAGDHTKNLAEEVCHLATGRSVRHLLRVHDKPAEQLYLEHLRRVHLSQET